MTIESAMQVGLTLSSLIYVATAFTSTVYGIWIAKEKEERELIKEAVHHTWVSYVKEQKRSGPWTKDEKVYACRLALMYVRNNEARLTRCCASDRARRESLVQDTVEARKAHAARLQLCSNPTVHSVPREVYEQL